MGVDVIAAELSHRDLGRTVTFEQLEGGEVTGCLVWMVATPAAVSVHLKHHGAEPYDLPPSHPVQLETPKEASQR